MTTKAKEGHGKPRWHVVYTKHRLETPPREKVRAEFRYENPEADEEDRIIRSDRKPGPEAIADAALREKGFETYYPFMRENQRVKSSHPNREHRLIRVERPILPRYLFVRVEKGQSLMDVCSADGVAGVLRIGDDPIIIPDDVMTDLMDRLDRLEPRKVVQLFDGQVGDKFRFGETSVFFGLIGRIASLEGVDESYQITAWCRAFGSERLITVPLSDVGQLFRAADESNLDPRKTATS